jgi:hypothetical protein
MYAKTLILGLGATLSAVAGAVRSADFPSFGGHDMPNFPGAHNAHNLNHAPDDSVNHTYRHIVPRSQIYHVQACDNADWTACNAAWPINVGHCETFSGAPIQSVKFDEGLLCEVYQDAGCPKHPTDSVEGMSCSFSVSSPLADGNPIKTSIGSYKCKKGSNINC